MIRVCSYCEATKTAMWRSGPDDSTLCNSCGIKWMRNKILNNENQRYKKGKRNLIKKTNDFAKLINGLDEHKTEIFVNILANSFQNKKNLHEIEFSVLDIDDKTWNLLRKTF